MKSLLSGRVHRGAPVHPHLRRRVVGTLLVGVLIVVGVACDAPPPPNPPYWHPGTTVDATNYGPMVHIAWDATTGGNPASAYQINLGTYDGTVVALVPSTTRSCYISGLAASTEYTIFVTARDASMAWSGPLPGTQGNRKTTITTTNHGGGGTNLWCHADVDADDDGIPDGAETNDGSYTGAGDTGTDPANPDTDDDGIPDGEEALGLGGVNLYAMGARPTHRDLLVEVDWLSDPTVCPGNGLRLTSTAIAMAATGYANSPLPNPDGDPGIKLIVDYGQGGAFTGGNAVPHPTGILGGNAASPQFQAVKGSHFDPDRLGTFHYAVYGRTGGTGEFRGNDIEVRRVCNGTNHLRDAGFLMHELGHNLGLDHDGVQYPFRDVNNMPNYNSVMNYRYVEGGVDTNCDGVGDGVLDYSDGGNADLYENSLSESLGICNHVDIDWNGDSQITFPVQQDINEDNGINVVYADAVLPLRDFDDWTHIRDNDGLACVRTCTLSQN